MTWSVLFTPFPCTKMGGMKKKEIKLIPVWRTRKWLPPSLREKARHVTKDSDFIYENEEITLPFDVDSFIEEKPPNKRSKPENETVSPPRETEIEGKSDSEIEEESNWKDCLISTRVKWVSVLVILDFI